MPRPEGSDYLRTLIKYLPAGELTWQKKSSKRTWEFRDSHPHYTQGQGWWGGVLSRFPFCPGARGSDILGLERTNDTPLASNGVCRSSYYMLVGGLLLLEPTGW